MAWRSVSRFVYRLVDRLDIPARVQRLASGQELGIVMYHGVVHDPLPLPDWCFIDEEQFADEVGYLAAQTHVLPLAEALERLRNGSLEEPAIAITFDDGFQSMHDIAFPILQELALPSTVFLATAFIDTPRTIWYCELIQMVSRTRVERLTWRGRRYDLHGTAARVATSAQLQATLKELHPDALREALLDIQLRLGLGDLNMEEVETPFRLLDRASIARMVRSGLVEFGAHTESHSILTRMDPHRANAEILGSVERTAELTGAPCRLFAYPNGRRQDYDEVAIAALRRAGISAAVTTMSGPNNRHTPQLELLRYGVGPHTELGRFKVDVHHLRSRGTRSAWLPRGSVPSR